MSNESQPGDWDEGQEAGMQLIGCALDPEGITALDRVRAAKQPAGAPVPRRNCIPGGPPAAAPETDAIRACFTPNCPEANETTLRTLCATCGRPTAVVGQLWHVETDSRIQVLQAAEPREEPRHDLGTVDAETEDSSDE